MNKARSPVYSQIGTTLEGLTCIKIFGVQKLFWAEFNGLKDTHSSTFLMYIGSYSWLLSTLNWLSLLFKAAVVLSFLLVGRGKKILLSFLPYTLLHVTYTLHYIRSLTSYCKFCY